ncbi:MAG TPA: energy-coupling factor ABC transporter permease [Burkholderiales bacterium]|nr:energy-coupling factor ABC transporter permease [Burkholderiales bacterium]
MNLPDNLLASGWLWAGHLLFALVLAYALRFAPWRRLKKPAQLHLFLGAVVALMVLWNIKTGIRPGLNFHMLGATALTLMFGPELALVGMALVLLGSTLAGLSGTWTFSLNALLMGVLPVLVSHAVYRIADTRLPNHFFVYVFVNGFFGAALAMASAGFVATALLGAAGAYSFSYLYGEYLPFYMLLAWSEALLTGMAVTLMAVYRPEWIGTFDDARYLRGK